MIVSEITTWWNEITFEKISTRRNEKNINMMKWEKYQHDKMRKIPTWRNEENINMMKWDNFENINMTKWDNFLKKNQHDEMG